MLTLAPLDLTDAEPMARLLNDAKTIAQLASVDFPYQIEDARAWIQECHKFDRDYGKTCQWAIRHNNQFIGEIGFHSFKPQHKTQASLGFWIGTPFRGQGFASEGIRQVCKIGFQNYGFKLIKAVVFEGNIASQKALEANDFENIGLKKNYVTKNSTAIHCWLYQKHI